LIGKVVAKRRLLYKRVGYFDSIPDPKLLKDELWQRRSELVGIEMNEVDQLKLVSEISSSKYKEEYLQLPVRKEQISRPHEYYMQNRFFGGADATVLYYMIRWLKPKRIIEVGSGYSTRLSAQALLRNKEDGHEGELTAIEPHPDNVLKEGFPGLTRLIPSMVQNVSPSEFMSLEKNDILFIDSSHVLKIGSDVQYEYLEILPRLQTGVIVQSHDIFLPAEYPKEWVLGLDRFWTEQYLLQAFLAFNDRFKVLWASSYMHLRHPAKLKAAFPLYDRATDWPGSLWMQRSA
jgi:methyltransferase family protein